MQVLLLAVLLVVACASTAARVESLVGYHLRVAIPMAKKIKEAEDAIIASQNPHARIVGGQISRANSHPYLGALLISYADNSGLGVCGSVLVSRTRLLTAAHCWFDGVTQAIRVAVVLGSNHLFSGGDRIATSTVVPHPQWNPFSQHNNLAVICLTNPVILTVNIQPIALATNVSEHFAGEWAVASGFGYTSDKQSSVAVGSVISEVTLQVITVDECWTSFGAMAQPNTLCTNGTGGVGTCLGDAGGPLVITRGGQPQLIGVATFGAAAGCEAGLPSGYSRVTSFLQFIQALL